MSEIVPAYVESKTAHLNPILDADSFVYRAGFSGVNRDEEGNPEPTPLAHSLANLRTIVDNILERFPRREWDKVLLTPSGGFRYKVATIRPYKGQRKSPKPQHFEAMRDYLQKKYGAIVVDEELPPDERREADDYCGMIQWKHDDKSTCIVGIDKDLLQIPGWHFNPVKDEFQNRTLRDANLFFWYQVCVGDSVDNIAGLKGMGPKKTEGLLESCGRKPVRVMKAVANLYKKEFSGKWKEALDENAQLLFIHREAGRDWKHYFGEVLSL
jgi:hypothetical protein